MASPVSTELPEIRACIFDLGGLLIDSESRITLSINQLLDKYGRPPITQSIRVQLMGVPNSMKSDVFHDWAKLPIPREEFGREADENTKLHFMDCEPLPGAERLLLNLSRARCVSSGRKIEMALASSTKNTNYKLKTSKAEIRELLDIFQAERRIIGENPRVPKGRGKPAPDIYLVALQAINDSLAADGKPILPSECLAFEDSIAGVEAGRRAGMRVVWVPHPDVVVEYQLKLKDILAGRSGMFDIGDLSQLGQVGDGWAESIPSLEDFDYEKYGITITS